ncbi:MAG: cupin domain-containing protein [Terriglobales bacterium]
MTRREANGALLSAAAALLALPLAGSTLTAQARQHTPVRSLMREPLAPIPDAEASVIILTLAPGEHGHPHEHTGPVFAYILKGAIENQVEPGAPKTYRAGDYFYEPPRHVHKMMRNLSPTATAEILVFEVGEKGKPFTIPAPSSALD